MRGEAGACVTCSSGEAARQRRRVAFHRAADLVCALIEACDAKELGRFRRRLERVDLLIVDELGCAPRGANEPRGARSPPGTVAAVPRS
ncbi:MAG: ATP-binding protein [Myxococcales bacterium]|nr:ATP-binding protein [Myxococcales bacterium]